VVVGKSSSSANFDIIAGYATAVNTLRNSCVNELFPTALVRFRVHAQPYRENL